MAHEKRNRSTKQPAARKAYEELWKQAADAWDMALRDPNVLTAMAAANAQQLELATRMREAFAGALKVMNLASRDDVSALGARLDALEAKLDRIAEAVTSPAPARPRRR